MMTDEHVQPATQRRDDWVAPTVRGSGWQRRTGPAPADPRGEGSNRLGWAPPRARVSGWTRLAKGG
jgi:hypothetical protein